jgi:hypothetical protein
MQIRARAVVGSRGPVGHTGRHVKVHPLTIRMFPAREGDCLVLTHGDPRAPHRILVDGGRMATYPALREFLAALPEPQRTFDLLIVTHIDRDHIEGILSLLADPACPVRFRDIWFNGYHHLSAGLLEFSAVQGNRLVGLLNGRAWNAAFAGGPIAAPDDGVDDPVALPGGLRIRVVSPSLARLRALRSTWDQECRNAGLDPDSDPPDRVEQLPFDHDVRDVDALAAAPFTDDRAPANGSTIAVLLSVDGRRILLGGDAHATVLVDNLRRLADAEFKPIKLDAFKVSHHGSANNTSQELLAQLRCPRYLISTSGAQFRHPDPECIARIIKFGGQAKTLFFNYRSPTTATWDDAEARAKYQYNTVYGTGGALTITL